jgi:hypothetical protein
MTLCTRPAGAFGTTRPDLTIVGTGADIAQPFSATAFLAWLFQWHAS